MQVAGPTPEVASLALLKHLKVFYLSPDRVYDAKHCARRVAIQVRTNADILWVITAAPSPLWDWGNELLWHGAG